MWSKLTEYAEGIADIVAPVDDPSVPSAESVEAAAEKAWTRWSSMVGGVASSSATQPSVASTSSSRSVAQHEREDPQQLIDENEQEQYICELERALLQRKKQNELLEKRINELETKSATILPEELEMKIKLQAQETELTQHRAQIDLLQKEKRHLSQTVAELKQNQAVKSLDGHDDDSRNSQVPNVAGLTLVAESLASTLPSFVLIEIPESSDGVVAQLSDLANKVKNYVDEKQERLQAFETTITSFLSLHGERTDSSEASSLESHIDGIQKRLGVLSQRLSKAAAEHSELEQLRNRLHMLEEREEEQMKAKMQLQAQVNSMQANKQRVEKSIQQTASKEVELVQTLEEKDVTIRQLQDMVAQYVVINKAKNSIAHLTRELEAVQSEADATQALCNRQKSEIYDLQQRIRQAEELQATFQNDEQEIRARAGEYEQGYVELLAEFEKVKAQAEEEKAILVARSEEQAQSIGKQAIYELESRLTASEADKQIAIQDAERLQRDMEALEGVLHQFQVDQKRQKEQIATLEAALEDAQVKLQHSAENPPNATSDDDMQRIIDALAKKTLECDQLREALENTAPRFSSEADVLDKRLAAQLVVSYFDSDKKEDVLQLMARILSFTEEQKRRVGIGASIEGNGGGGLFSSIIGLVAPPDSSNPQHNAAMRQVNIDGKSFADIWTEFLINEAKR